METSPMVRELAGLLRRYVDRAGAGGVRVSLEWLTEVLDGNEVLARTVLRAAGFQPPEGTEWHTGRGARRLSELTYPPILADNLVDVLDDYAPV